MSKTMKKSLAVILIVIIIFVMLWLVYDMFKKEPADANTVDTNLADENTGLDNVINDLFENTVENKTDENIDKKNDIVADDDTKNEEKQNEHSETTSGSVTSREEKAIKLVQEVWGDLDGVYCTNMGIDNNGKYIVSVNSKDTAVLAWYLVDVDSGLVTKQ